MALTRKGAPFVWMNHQQQAFEALKACLVSAPILGFPTENGRFVLDTDANADGMSRQCGQCQRPDYPVSATDSPVPDAEPDTGLVDQHFASSEMGESMDTDLLPELSGETWVASALLKEFTADLLPAGGRPGPYRYDGREWIQSESIPVWAECAGFSPELRCWRLQVGNLSIDTDGRLWRRRARVLNW